MDTNTSGPSDIDEVDFLIVGGGPAGLSTALSLQYHTLLTASDDAKRPRILVVDALPHGQNESRALAIIPRTLELLDEIGCAEPLVPFGIESTGINMQSAPKPSSPGSVLIRVDFSSLKNKTEFPYGLVIAQHITEAAFTKILQDRGEKDPNSKVSLLRGMKVVDIKDSEREIEGGIRNGFVVTYENGESTWCQYLIGADGSRSIVRTLSQTPFEDPGSGSSCFGRAINRILTSHSQEYICLADVEFEEDIGKKHRGAQQRPVVTFGPVGFLIFGPVKISGASEQDGPSEENGGPKEQFVYRIGFPFPADELEQARKSLSLDKSSSVSLSSEPGGNGTNGYTPVFRDEYETTPEAISYLQDKINEGLRHIPDNPSPDDLPICPANGTSPHIKKVIWTSTFRIRYAVADVFHKAFSSAEAEAGHVLLVGDAAHVHSPVGGQGMNLGIRDGLECGKAIADYWRLSSSSSRPMPDTSASPFAAFMPVPSPEELNAIFERYSTTRREEAIQIINITKRMSWFATLKGGSIGAWIRDWLLWLVGRSKYLKNRFVWTMSGLGRSRERAISLQ